MAALGIISEVLKAIKTIISKCIRFAISVLKKALDILKKIAEFLWERYCGFCDKHNFRPVKLVSTFVVVIFVITSIFSISVLAKNRQIISSQYGLIDVGELVTQAYHYKQIRTIRDSQQLWGWNIPLTQKECIFSYEGEVRAGFNFEEIEVSVNESTKLVTVILPEPYIVTNEIFTETLLIYDEDSNIFNPLHLDELGGEIEDIRNAGEEEAKQNGVFDAAKANGEIIIKGFLSGAFDFDVYKINFEYKE